MNPSAAKKLLWALLIAVLIAALSCVLADNERKASIESNLAPTDLLCDGLKHPRGIDVGQPVFSWKLHTLGSGQAQTAYQILVASSRKTLASGTPDLWDSGKVDSGRILQVRYAGRPLAPGAYCFWKVRTWDAKGRMSDWSETSLWTMGLLAAANSDAKWIGLDGGSLNGSDRQLPARWLRREFALSKNVARASVSFCGLGWSELYLNGQKIGDHLLSPPLSEYPKREYYESYEVTKFLQRGNNALGVVLGNGRFYAPRANALSSGFPKLFLQLHLEYTDGTSSDVVSDDAWRVTTYGPITANNEYDGEEYDARAEFSGWDRPGFDDSTWQPAEIVSAPEGILSAVRQEPVRVTAQIKPVSVKEISPGVFIFDMGQNFAGWCRINVQGPAGTRVTLRHAETLNSDGTLYTNNLRSAKATDGYTLKGEGREVWQPRFTLHGFRFVEVTGWPGKPSLDSLTGCVVGDDLSLTGEFECSNPLINSIYHNIVWGVRGNYRSIPTDCPQRDERQGWLGDRAEESRGETYFFDNDALYAKWLQDMADCQRNGSVPSVCPAYWDTYRDDVTWAGANLMIPGMLRDQFGDEQVVAEHYDCARQWIEHMEGFITNGIMSRDTYGDWCMPPENPRLIHSTDPTRITAKPLLATPFFYHDLLLMQSYAVQLGYTNDAAHYAEVAQKMKAAFNDKYLDRDTGQYGNGTPTSAVLPLAFGMVPEDLRFRVFHNLVNKLTIGWNDHISTGLVGAKYLLRVLSENGRPDLAYAILTQTDYPSWGYMVEHGATTVWELWNGDTADPAMNSGNHVMLIGDVAIWLYENLAGIKADPLQPGFKHIIMRPTPVGDLTFVNASHLSPYGLIRSQWRRTENEFDWHVEIPPGSTATIYLPTVNVDSVTDNDQPITDVPGVSLVRVDQNGPVTAALQSGSYDFVCEDINPELAFTPQATQAVSP